MVPLFQEILVFSVENIQYTWLVFIMWHNYGDKHMIRTMVITTRVRIFHPENYGEISPRTINHMIPTLDSKVLVDVRSPVREWRMEGNTRLLLVLQGGPPQL